jgi:hypothetical protein
VLAVRLPLCGFWSVPRLASGDRTSRIFSSTASIDNGPDLGIEASLFKSADKLRGSMDVRR